MNKKRFLLALGGMVFMGCLAGGGVMAAAYGDVAANLTVSAEDDGMTPAQASNETTYLAASAEDDGESAVCFGGGYDGSSYVSYEEQFKPYAQFGMTYDAGKNELQYNGKAVRWFEDYYPLSEDGAQAGIDFFNENGVVDVYAVRDLSDPVRFDDGSFDPSGKLIGVKEFSEEEFASRDIEAIKNPKPITAIAGDGMLSVKELEEIAKEYAAFGVTYDAKDNEWYFNGEKVRVFKDVLTSNGESLTGGNFKGTIRTFAGDGTIDIDTVRDFSNLNASGNGTLIGIEVK